MADAQSRTKPAVFGAISIPGKADEDHANRSDLKVQSPFCLTVTLCQDSANRLLTLALF